MRKTGSSAGAIPGLIGIAVIAIPIGFALWRISSSATTFAAAGFSLESSQAWSFLIFCLGVAGLTMSLVQVSRMLYPFRGVFHRRALERWLSLTGELSLEMPKVATSINDFGANNEVAGGPKDAKDAARVAYDEAKLKAQSDWDSLLKELGLKEPNIGEALTEFEQRRGVGFELIDEADLYPSSMDLYDLPIEQLSGQLNLALEAGLDEPKRFRNLIVLMAGKEGAADLLNVVRPLSKTPTNAIKWTEPKGETGPSVDALAQAQSRAAITRIVQLRIDSFQITTGGRWRHRLRLMVLGVSFLFSFIVLFSSTPLRGATVGVLLVKLANMPVQAAYSLVVGAIGGYLAMFLRDLTVIVENKRRRA